MQTHITREVVNKLNSEGFVVIKNVLSQSELSSARKDIESIRKEGRFEYAENRMSEIRQDQTCWVRDSDGTADAVSGSGEFNTLGDGLLHCVSMLRGTAFALEKMGYDRSDDHIVPTQCQLSCYFPSESKAPPPPPTARASGSSSDENEEVIGYAPHRDSASDDNFWEIGLLEW